MDDLTESLFWAMLDQESQAVLENNSTISTYSRGLSFLRYPSDPLLVLDGIICLTTFERTNMILVPGDMVLSPDFRPQISYTPAMTDADLSSLYSNQRWQCISEVKIAIFNPDAVSGLLESNQSFTRAVLNCQLNLLGQMSFLQANLYHYSAYHAVRYIMRLCQIYGIGNLTHAQIAMLCSRNRSTVTQAIHEICLAEPDFFGSIDESSEMDRP